jgi:hypothetical protein
MADTFFNNSFSDELMGVKGRRGPQATHPAAAPPRPLRNTRKAVLGMTCPQGIEGSGMAGLSDTLGTPWPSLALRPWLQTQSCP